MKTTVYTLSCLLAGILFPGCSGDDYKPGKPVDSNSPVVYFESENSSMLELVSGENDSFLLTLSRENSSGALSVPIETVYASTSLSIPASAEFASGEYTSSIEIKILPEAAKNMELAYSLAIRDSHLYSDPYSETEGTSVFRGKVILWEPWELFAEITFTPGAYSGGEPDFLPFQQTVQWRPSSGLYQIENFLYNNAGYNFTFTVGADHAIVPEQREGFHDTGSDSRWYFYIYDPEATEELSKNRIPCYLPNAGSGDYITYIYFYQAGSNANFKFDAENRTGAMCGYARFFQVSSGRITFTLNW